MVDQATTSTSTIQYENKINLITGIENNYTASGTPDGFTHIQYSVPLFPWLVIAICGIMVLWLLMKGHKGDPKY